jgi:hypothetical protein
MLSRNCAYLIIAANNVQELPLSLPVQVIEANRGRGNYRNEEGVLCRWQAAWKPMRDLGCSGRITSHQRMDIRRLKRLLLAQECNAPGTPKLTHHSMRPATAAGTIIFFIELIPGPRRVRRGFWSDPQNGELSSSTWDGGSASVTEPNPG